MVEHGGIWCDAEAIGRAVPGTSIGMSNIKQRRLTRLTLSSHPGLHVGECVPFYFCPRSVMLYLLYKGNHQDLGYRQGQGPVVHLEADLFATIQWAERIQKRWAFTLSNAGSHFFEDRCDVSRLYEINWEAVHTNRWSGRDISPDIMEGKQAEFLIEERFPWHLVERVGVISQRMAEIVLRAISSDHRPLVEVKPSWYY
jgi:hypothetical protein